MGKTCHKYIAGDRNKKEAACMKKQLHPRGLTF